MANNKSFINVAVRFNADDMPDLELCQKHIRERLPSGAYRRLAGRSMVIRHAVARWAKEIREQA